MNGAAGFYRGFLAIWYAELLMDENEQFTKEQAFTMATLTPLQEIIKKYVEQTKNRGDEADI